MHTQDEGRLDNYPRTGSNYSQKPQKGHQQKGWGLPAGVCRGLKMRTTSERLGAAGNETTQWCAVNLIEEMARTTST